MLVSKNIMGIPSYFSYIIHNHSGVVCKYLTLIQNNIQFQRLYMDCNSILYDCYRQMPADTVKWEDWLLDATAHQIDTYIRQICPSQLVYIAFDGVAPVAKMEQQRTRRYKSWFEGSVMNHLENKAPLDPARSTCMFTPGTPFMQKLSHYMRARFVSTAGLTIRVATPDEPGEGEHKLFEHMRKNPTDQPSAVYGLDADLMMLGLFHLAHCPNTYIFREAPQFAKTLLQKTQTEVAQPDEPLFIDVAKLGRSIANEMRCGDPDPHRMYDYVFMCFLLGNDFLPHFPALNIRTGGIDALLDTYRGLLGNKQETFLLSKTNPPTIQWQTLSKFMQELAKHEYGFWCQEYATRKRWDQKPPQMHRKKTLKERTDLFQNTPVLYRKEEKYINPYESGWETRYYRALFAEGTQVQDVCLNYLEGLEWVYQYYIQGRVDWTWCYKYHYPPLLKDLAPKVPHRATTFLPTHDTKPVSPQAQLAYVLPPVYHDLLLSPTFVQNNKQYYDGYEYTEDGLPKLEFQWAFCRYFWECHVHLPTIPTETLLTWST